MYRHREGLVTLVMCSYFQLAPSVIDRNGYLPFYNIDVNNTMKVEHCNVIEALAYSHTRIYVFKWQTVSLWLPEISLSSHTKSFCENSTAIIICHPQYLCTFQVRLQALASDLLHTHTHTQVSVWLSSNT